MQDINLNRNKQSQQVSAYSTHRSSVPTNDSELFQKCFYQQEYIQPPQEEQEFSNSSGNNNVYLDHAEGVLFTTEQVENSCSSIKSGITKEAACFHPSSTHYDDSSRAARYMTLSMLNASPKDYDVIFTPSATAACQLLASRFPWSESSIFFQTVDNHQSVLSMSDVARQYGARIQSVKHELNGNVTEFISVNSEGEGGNELDLVIDNQPGGVGLSSTGWGGMVDRTNSTVALYQLGTDVYHQLVSSQEVAQKAKKLSEQNQVSSGISSGDDTQSLQINQQPQARSLMQAQSSKSKSRKLPKLQVGRKQRKAQAPLVITDDVDMIGDRVVQHQSYAVNQTMQQKRGSSKQAQHQVDDSSEDIVETPYKSTSNKKRGFMRRAVSIVTCGAPTKANKKKDSPSQAIEPRPSYSTDNSQGARGTGIPPHTSPRQSKPPRTRSKILTKLLHQKRGSAKHVINHPTDDQTILSATHNHTYSPDMLQAAVLNSPRATRGSGTFGQAKQQPFLTPNASSVITGSSAGSDQSFVDALDSFGSGAHRAGVENSPPSPPPSFVGNQRASTGQPVAENAQVDNTTLTTSSDYLSSDGQRSTDQAVGADSASKREQWWQFIAKVDIGSNNAQSTPHAGQQQSPSWSMHAPTTRGTYEKSMNDDVSSVSPLHSPTSIEANPSGGQYSYNFSSNKGSIGNRHLNPLYDAPQAANPTTAEIKHIGLVSNPVFDSTSYTQHNEPSPLASNTHLATLESHGSRTFLDDMLRDAASTPEPARSVGNRRKKHRNRRLDGEAQDSTTAPSVVTGKGLGGSMLDTTAAGIIPVTSATGVDMMNTGEQMNQRRGSVCDLLALPFESNFNGKKYNLDFLQSVCGFRDDDTEAGNQDERHVLPTQQRRQLFVLIDAARACSNCPPDLQQSPADFVALSYYKIFGYPTGLGALVVKKKTLSYMNNPLPVDLDDPSLRLQVTSIQHGFQRIVWVGGYPSLTYHTWALTAYIKHAFTTIRHASNNRKVIKIYDDVNRKYKTYKRSTNNGQVPNNTHSAYGPTIAFNVLNANGAIIPWQDVVQLAKQQGIVLGGGTFMNIGAVRNAYGLPHQQSLYATNVNIDPALGTVRVSFGTSSSIHHVQKLLDFIRSTYAVAPGADSGGSDAGGVDVVGVDTGVGDVCRVQRVCPMKAKVLSTYQSVAQGMAADIVVKANAKRQRWEQIVAMEQERGAECGWDLVWGLHCGWERSKQRKLDDSARASGGADKQVVNIRQLEVNIADIQQNMGQQRGGVERRVDESLMSRHSTGLVLNTQDGLLGLLKKRQQYEEDNDMVADSGVEVGQRQFSAGRDAQPMEQSNASKLEQARALQAQINALLGNQGAGGASDTKQALDSGYSVTKQALDSGYSGKELEVMQQQHSRPAAVPRGIDSEGDDDDDGGGVDEDLMQLSPNDAAMRLNAVVLHDSLHLNDDQQHDEEDDDGMLIQSQPVALLQNGTHPSPYASIPGSNPSSAQLSSTVDDSKSLLDSFIRSQCSPIPEEHDVLFDEQQPGNEQQQPDKEQQPGDEQLADKHGVQARAAVFDDDVEGEVGLSDDDSGASTVIQMPEEVGGWEEGVGAESRVGGHDNAEEIHPGMWWTEGTKGVGGDEEGDSDGADGCSELLESYMGPGMWFKVPKEKNGEDKGTGGVVVDQAQGARGGGADAGQAGVACSHTDHASSVVTQQLLNHYN